MKQTLSIARHIAHHIDLPTNEAQATKLPVSASADFVCFVAESAFAESSLRSPAAASAGGGCLGVEVEACGGTQSTGHTSRPGLNSMGDVGWQTGDLPRGACTASTTSCSLRAAGTTGIHPFMPCRMWRSSGDGSGKRLYCWPHANVRHAAPRTSAVACAVAVASILNPRALLRVMLAAALEHNQIWYVPRSEMHPTSPERFDQGPRRTPP